jgi:hypothetical protein
MWEMLHEDFNAEDVEDERIPKRLPSSAVTTDA